jgi:hypothetical protein
MRRRIKAGSGDEAAGWIETITAVMCKCESACKGPELWSTINNSWHYCDCNEAWRYSLEGFLEIID